MPKAYVFKEEDFLKFKERMLKEGFRQIEPYEFYTELRVADIEPPTPRYGREEGFIFTCLGMEVRVWTSFIKSEGCVRKLDSGWDVIREFGQAKYFAPQMYRTIKFFDRLFDWAVVCKEHIQARPVCPKCRNRYMSIVYKGNLQYYWKCLNPVHFDEEGKTPCKDWDIGLSQKSLAIVKKKRKRRLKYNRKRKKENKPTFGTARKNRKPWKKKNPQPGVKSQIVLVKTDKSI